jgi:hypothetical protein
VETEAAKVEFIEGGRRDIKGECGDIKGECGDIKGRGFDIEGDTDNRGECAVEVSNER